MTAARTGWALWGDRLLLAITIIVAALWLLPVIWVVTMSLKPNAELMRSTWGFIPYPFTIENYTNLIQLATVPRWLVNSLIVAIGMTLLVLTVSSLAGYAFARLQFPFKRTIFALMIAGLMIPEQAVFLPLHQMFADWGIHNTHAALVMPRVAVPIGVFLMMQFFRAVPRELEEAAELDHASRFTIFFRIMLPLSVPALTTLGLFTFIHAWNDFLWPLVSATDADMYTVTVGLASIQGNFAMSEGLGSVMASAVFASLPIVLLFLIFQRFIVAGVAMSAGK
ncbi:carbohydrate ABC transporter permease [Rubellimicrobium rubrum]|uniref:sn-glycerol-3-phosphate transport system permease protein UgpE n=1 Tax=Rubellimicrobium rubrum TaxID=2585369 RepID=A0A5C4N4Z4_9RHOB|nr:carbohydrate ABC transporter permease [Rubellimicrobium rubrum]TNC53015.1 carbohydrate ABC transporter permease [Rubellimicrobium rubrum]